MARDIYSEVTDRILEALDQGVIPWHRPWKTTGNVSGLPSNAITNRCYSGLNILLLWLTSHQRGYRESRWLTFNQARQAGGMVRKGEKGTLVTLWKPFEKEDEQSGEKKKLLLLRGFTVFNLEQVDGLELSAEPSEPRLPMNEAARQVVERTGANVQHRGNQAFYSPAADQITMPELAAFESEEAYWGTLLHELTHWTGHASRCDRFQEARTKANYAFEELVAEMGSAFLCAQVGVPLEGLQHPSYLDHWRKVLQEDNRAIMRAASLARQASEFILVGGAEIEEDEAA